MLTPEKKQKSVEICEELLKCCCEEGDQFLLNIVTGDESWIHHFDPEEKRGMSNGCVTLTLKKKD